MVSVLNAVPTRYATYAESQTTTSLLKCLAVSSYMSHAVRGVLDGMSNSLRANRAG